MSSKTSVMPSARSRGEGIVVMEGYELNNEPSSERYSQRCHVGQSDLSHFESNPDCQCAYLVKSREDRFIERMSMIERESEG